MVKRLLALVALVLPALAQTEIHDALVKHWKASGDFTLAVAKAMPPGDYDFKPFPEVMTFRAVLLQVGMADRDACSYASGQQPSPLRGKVFGTNVRKEMVIQFLSDTFSYCSQAVAAITARKLESVAPNNSKMTVFENLWAHFTHTAHYRAQLEFYLRAKGVKPPDYAF